MSEPTQVTHLPCPDAPTGSQDNSTHHMVPGRGGEMVCSYCHRTRGQILARAALDSEFFRRFSS